MACRRPISYFCAGSERPRLAPLPFVAWPVVPAVRNGAEKGMEMP
ncbi:hypothetical protein SXCC_04705 [Gluconacetobacter sp. SXCC-1]|nr:hypothetical protein SXCC_04705 [Gluconacetobacter sp. SXCC-1]